jgi:hypothetical protein
VRYRVVASALAAKAGRDAIRRSRPVFCVANHDGTGFGGASAVDDATPTRPTAQAIWVGWYGPSTRGTSTFTHSVTPPMPTYHVFIDCSTRTNQPTGLYDTFVNASAADAARGDHVRAATRRARILGYCGPYRIHDVRCLGFSVSESTSRSPEMSSNVARHDALDPSSRTMAKRLESLLCEVAEIEAEMSRHAHIVLSAKAVGSAAEPSTRRRAVRR